MHWALDVNKIIVDRNDFRIERITKKGYLISTDSNDDVTSSKEAESRIKSNAADHILKDLSFDWKTESNEVGTRLLV